MSANKNDRKVVFRRIRGRVIPISIGGGLLAASKKVASPEAAKATGQFVGKKLSKQFYGSVKDTNTWYANQAVKTNILSRLYKPKTRYGTDVKVHFSPFLDHPASYSPGGIRMKVPSEATFLHELGHAQQKSARLSTLQKINSKTRQFLHRQGSDLRNNPISKIKNYSLRKARNGSAHFSNLITRSELIIDEADAWRRAVKTARPGRKMNVLKSSVYPMASYTYKPILKATSALLAAGGIAAIAYGLLKKNKDKK